MSKLTTKQNKKVYNQTNEKKPTTKRPTKNPQPIRFISISLHEGDKQYFYTTES